MAETERDQKTEDATPRRRRDARDRGQVALSQELGSALMLCAAVLALVVGGESLARTVGGLLRTSLGLLGDKGIGELAPKSAAALLEATLKSVAPALLAFVLPIVAVGLVAGYGQVGLRLSPKALELDWSKLDPIKGFGRIFSLNAVVRTGLSILKIAAIATSMTVVAMNGIGDVVRIGTQDLGPLVRGIGYLALRCSLAALAAILALALIDLFYQRYQFARGLRMSKQEIKDEYRNTEGDPKVKARIRAQQREMATRRMMADVPKATVVVTNPTHYAVALRYERDESGTPRQAAPTVVAKGVDLIAQRIKEIAREADVPCYEDVALARSLYAQCEVGQEVPKDLYAAVAAVLAYVYRARGEGVTD